MTIYMIAKSVSCRDYDDWHHWVEQSPQSYHLTPEGAENMVQVLIAKELQFCKDPEHIAQIKRNRNNFTLGENGENCEERELFVITALDVQN